jgi:histidinol dehydrogenase
MRVTQFEWEGDGRSLASQIRALSPRLEQVASSVAEILARVREGGDAAVRELDRHFGEAARGNLRVEPAEIEDAAASLDGEVLDALRLAADNIRSVAEAQPPREQAVDLPQGQRVEVREIPVVGAGAYVPGGRAAYPSTALMCCLPARVAGVERVVVASPADGDGRVNAGVLAACSLAGVDEVYATGGAQAVAALALGTETIPPVDVVVGPGNRYVQEAKRQLAGTVAFDSIAGPSELMLVLGETANLEWAALDLCAQAEHGDDGLLVAAAVESTILDRLQQQVEALAGAWASVGDPPLALVAVPDTDSALELANALAPEHLQLACQDAELMAGSVRTAGCVFVGERAATAFGDYVAGSNHVLPTGGAGRFAGPLGPEVFRRPISIVEVPDSALPGLAGAAATLARVEGFPVHGESAEARSKAKEAM